MDPRRQDRQQRQSAEADASTQGVDPDVAAARIAFAMEKIRLREQTEERDRAETCMQSLILVQKVGLALSEMIVRLESTRGKTQKYFHNKDARQAAAHMKAADGLHEALSDARDKLYLYHINFLGDNLLQSLAQPPLETAD